MTEDNKKALLDGIKYLFEEKKCHAITGDCGFFMNVQDFVRQNTKRPVFMSALAQLPAVTCAFGVQEDILIMTANGATLEPMRNLIRDECEVDTQEKRFIFCCCEDVDGFEAVALGEKVDTVKCTPGIVAKCQTMLKEHPAVRAILLECTELPPYADAQREATGLPVYDAISACDFFMSGLLDNKRFGLQDWQQNWDGTQENYKYAMNLTQEQKAALTNVADDDDKIPDAIRNMNAGETVDSPAEHPSLGVMRLDYDHPPAPGDVDCSDSYSYDVFYRVVPGFTFAMCQAGKLSPEVEQEFLKAINWLTDVKKVSAITGDCGFMMFYQELARSVTHKPVFMSALAQLPAVTCAFGVQDLEDIAHIFIFHRSFRKIKLRFCGAEVERTLQKWFSLWVFWSNVIF